MGLISWFLKPKSEMAKKNTKPVKIGKYTVSSHAQNRVVEKERNLTKKDIPINLFTKPIKITKIRVDDKVVGVCALVGAGVGGTTSAIVGAIDGEVSFQEVAANFGAGLVVGAAVGAVTGVVTYNKLLL